MPFPTTGRVSRIITAPPGSHENIVEQVAQSLRRSGLAGVTTGQAVVRFDAADSPGQSALPSSGEIEIVGGPHLYSLGGGLIAGGLIALVPWAIARLRLAAVLRRIARGAEGHPDS